MAEEADTGTSVEQDSVPSPDTDTDTDIESESGTEFFAEEMPASGDLRKDDTAAAPLISLEEALGMIPESLQAEMRERLKAEFRTVIYTKPNWVEKK